MHRFCGAVISCASVSLFVCGCGKDESWNNIVNENQSHSALSPLTAGQTKWGYGTMSPECKVVGLWQSKDGEKQLMEFFEDGSFRVKVKDGELGDFQNLSGKWIVLRDGRLKLELSALGITQAVLGDLKFEGEEMILSDETGPTRFTRIK